MTYKLESRFQSFHNQIVDRKARGAYPYFRKIEEERGTTVLINGKEKAMFGSNNYLSLAQHPQVKEAAIHAIRKYGSGCSGSRFLNGSRDLHEELEYRLARFLNKDAALVFATGYQTNIGVISALFSEKDTIINDIGNHASIIDASRLSPATKLWFKHNHMGSLAQKLKAASDSSITGVIVDGIFSMEGDLSNLPEITKLAKAHEAMVIVDCAHAIGVIGENGAGTASHFGLTDEVAVITGTFSKSLASVGGFVAASEVIVEYIRHHGNSMIFSASISPANAASALAALNIIETDPAPMQKLWDNTNYAHHLCRELGLEIGNTASPIVPIYIRNAEKTIMLSNRLFDEGIFVNAILPPAVKPKDTLLRFCLMADHTPDQITHALTRIHALLNELNNHPV